MNKNYLSLPLFKKKININLYAFYMKNKRDLLWRDSTNPYFIMVSEFMLQQTQVNRVVEYFNRFILMYGTIDKLAHAEQKDILLIWSGLGYNRRAIYLHNAAKVIVEKYKGIIPDDYLKLQDIKGIGEYTAKAIVTYSYNIPHIFVETNIRSVFFILYRKFCSQFDKIDDSMINAFLVSVIDKSNPREWYYAMMDFGAYLKKKYKNKHIQKSKQFTFQSNFKNSFRQFRGNIVKFLLKRNDISEDDLKKFFPDDRFEECLLSLQKDKIIFKKENIISLL